MVEEVSILTSDSSDSIPNFSIYLCDPRPLSFAGFSLLILENSDNGKVLHRVVELKELMFAELLFQCPGHETSSVYREDKFKSEHVTCKCICKVNTQINPRLPQRNASGPFS